MIAVVLACLSAGCADVATEQSDLTAGDDGSQERLLQPLQVEDVTLPAAPSATVPSAQTAAALEKFLGDIGSAIATETNQGVFVDWHYSDAPKILWSESPTIQLVKFGCGAGSAVDKALCFLKANQDLFGILSSDEELEFLWSTTLKNGRQKIRFGQVHSGLPVRGAHVTITMNKSGDHITRVVSYLVRGVQIVPAYAHTNLISLVAPGPEKWRAPVEAQVKDKLATWSGFVPMLQVDQQASSIDAVPVFISEVTTEGGERYEVMIDPASLLVVHVEKMVREDATVRVDSATVLRNYTGTACSSDGQCGSSPWICHQDEYLASCDKCALGCTSANDNSDCRGTYGSDWKCFDNVSDDFYKYCWLDATSDYEKIYDNAYQDADYACHHYFKYAVDAMLDWKSFIYGDLGRNSWDNADGQLTLYMKKACLYNCGSPAGGSGRIYMPTWYPFEGGTADDAVSNRFHIIGHEGGHSVLYSAAGGWPSNNDCVGENLADFMGSLFARDKLPSAYWSSGSHRETPWSDQTCGLAPCSIAAWDPPGNVPYSHRSRYDWMPCLDETQVWSGTSCAADSDCPPYYSCQQHTPGNYECTLYPYNYNNRSIWPRFARILAEGPSTFAADGNSEDIGVSFTAVGLPTTIDIVYDAFLDLTTSSTQYDFAAALVSAGSDAGKVTEVRNALGAVGYRGALYGFNGSGQTDETPRAVTFFAWTQSSTKTFYVYKDSASYDIKVVYHNGTSWTSSTISANTANTPAVAIYNSRLHVFWRDRSNDHIKCVYFSSGGTLYGTYDLGGATLALLSKGAFDAVDFNGYLYLVFTRPNSDYIYVAKCSRDTYGCTDSAAYWTDFGSGVYYKSLNWYGMPGLATAAGGGLNGSSNLQTQYMYVASAYPSSGSSYYRRIRVLRVSTNDSVSASDYRWLPNTFPSYRSDNDSVLGAELRNSAFADGNKYLYLVWNDYGTNELFTSILQDFNEANTNVDGAWFTRSMKLGRQSYDGATFWEYDSTQSARHVYSTTGDSPAYNVIWAYY